MEFNKIIVNNVKIKETIYTYLKRNGYSENYVKNLRKKEGFIKLNGKTSFTNTLVNDGDLIELCKNPNTPSSVMHCMLQLNIVYEDDDLLIVNKPSGLVTSASKSHYTQNLTGAIASHMSSKDNNFVVRIVNRLDKDTCGLIIVAKHSLCSNLLSNSPIKKTYYAIATGKICNEVTINKNILTSKNALGYNNQKREISNLGKPAITHVEPIYFDGINTLVKLNLHHGRTHQIRVHLAHIGHPLLGDLLYGQPSTLIDHTALICKEIEFIHPFTKEEIKISIPFDQHFKNYLSRYTKLEQF